MNNIKLEKFNSCPGAEEIAKYLRDNKLDEVFEVADADRNLYQNDTDTLVLRWIKDERELTFQDGIHLMGLARRFDADEFDHTLEKLQVYCRIWWD